MGNKKSSPKPRPPLSSWEEEGDGPILYRSPFLKKRTFIDKFALGCAHPGFVPNALPCFPESGFFPNSAPFSGCGRPCSTHPPPAVSKERGRHEMRPTPSASSRKLYCVCGVEETYTK
ncbi:hypothetical protein TNIN_343291 [Trichonephila inaurata madagascariensis]|uniref:Uncharacterized protein n=1 Tax=Trichonephila inaurata madagascariensis TaxID=2747483 RepID=A0A8X6XCS4_9ARAC|nr:hypothetical protein TNIN_343291 [Trichonephila inaurata madagascariensis]